jgi:hypothetical protein
MLKYLLALIIFPVLISSKQDGATVYRAKGILYKVTDESGHIVKDGPVGKNVSITYDQFFKSFKIRFTDEDGKQIQVKFKYVATDTLHGAILEGTMVLKMKDDSGRNYNVFDELKDRKKISFCLLPDDLGNSFIMYIENAELSNSNQ